MGVANVINPHWLMEILWDFFNICEIQWKRFKHGVNITADV